MGLLILRLLVFTTFASVALCQSTYTSTIFSCSTSYQTTPTAPVPTTDIFTTQYITLTSTVTSGTTTTTLALGLPVKVTSATIVTTTTTVTAPTHTQTSTITATAGVNIVTITPSATTVSSTSSLYVSGSTSIITIVPPPVTATSISTTSGAEATLTVTTKLVQNNKRQVDITDPLSRRHNTIERRARIYPKEVYCVHDVAIGTIITSTTYLHTSVKYASTTVTSTTTFTQSRTLNSNLVARASPHDTKSEFGDLGSEPNDYSDHNLDNYYYKTTIYVTSTATAVVVTVTANPSTTTDFIISTSTPSPTTVTVTTTVTLTSSTSSPPPASSTTTSTIANTTPDLAPTCTAITPDGEDEDDSYVLYYSGSGYIENLDNPSNDDPDDYPPIYTKYSGTLDVCSVAQLCADQANLVDNADYYSFDLHYLQSNQSWVCVQFYDGNLNDDARYFNVPDEDAIAVYGYSDSDH